MVIDAYDVIENINGNMIMKCKLCGKQKILIKNNKGEKMTKVQLMTANAQLAKDCAELQVQLNDAKQASNNEYIRKEFAKAFGWYKSSPYGPSDREPRIPSWSEIFTEVGKLLGHIDDENRLLNIETTLEHFNAQFQKLTKEK